MARRVFVDANVLIAGADSRSGASNAILQMVAKPDRFVTLNTKHFTEAVAQASELTIRTPTELVQEVRFWVEAGLG